MGPVKGIIHPLHTASSPLYAPGYVHRTLLVGCLSSTYAACHYTLHAHDKSVDMTFRIPLYCGGIVELPHRRQVYVLGPRTILVPSMSLGTLKSTSMRWYLPHPATRHKASNFLVLASLPRESHRKGLIRLVIPILPAPTISLITPSSITVVTPIAVIAASTIATTTSTTHVPVITASIVVTPTTVPVLTITVITIPTIAVVAPTAVGGVHS